MFFPRDSVFPNRVLRLGLVPLLSSDFGGCVGCLYRNYNIKVLISGGIQIGSSFKLDPIS